MVKLTMVAPRSHQISSICFDHLDKLPNFHGWSLLLQEAGSHDGERRAGKMDESGAVFIASLFHLKLDFRAVAYIIFALDHSASN